LRENDAEWSLWPAIGAWELEDFFRRLRATVLDLESANRGHRLAERLAEPEVRRAVGPEVIQGYERLLRERSDRLEGLRLDAVHALLDQARREIFEIREYATARVLADGAGEDGGETDDAASSFDADDADGGCLADPRGMKGAILHGDVVAARLGNGPEEYLRLDEVLAARFWGVGFVFDDPARTDFVAGEIARQTASRLGRDLRHLQKVLLRFRPQNPEQVLRMVPKPEERGFEQLMLDVLNEERPCARAAPLSEDFLEKTDLRVRYPGLERKRGGRVQVTQITDDALHRGKLERIRYVHQFVVLSPLTLASFVDGELHRKDEGPRVLEHFDLDAFWHCLPDQPTDLAALAASIKRLLIGALRAPIKSPRGPLAQVPWALRNVIRLYVKHDVFRATSALRADEARAGAGASGHGRRR
jgi:hypothetical protein